MKKAPKTTIKLGDVAKIRIGQSFRKAVTEDPSSSCFLIQTKDLLLGARVSSDLMRISTTDETPKPNVEVGDIIMLCRGVRFSAGVISNLPGPTVAQNMFYIISLKESCGLLSEYAASYINSSSIQEYFKALGKGATVQHIRVSDLASLSMQLPPLKEQQKIVALANAQVEEQQLLEHLSGLRTQQLNAIFQTLYK